MSQVFQVVEARETRPLDWQRTMFAWVPLIACFAAIAVGFTL